jgi:glycosyltransferase involved in cell wall biosynthesis
MRITFLLPTLDMSGGNRVVAMHADGLARMGHDVVVIVARKRKMSLRQRFRTRSWIDKAPPSIESMKAASHFASLAVEVRLASKRGAIRPDDVPNGDVIIATWWETAEWLQAFPESKGAKVSFVQGYELFDGQPHDRVRSTYRGPFHRIAVAKWLVDLLANEYGDRSVDLVPNAADHSIFFAPERGRQRLPTVGLLFSSVPLKGVATASSALKRLKEIIPELKVLSFGSGAAENFYGMEAFIDFMHRPPQEKIRDIYSRCDVWLSASTTEGFNLTAMEAMVCRTPVIATKTGWPLEAIIDGRNGFLVDIGDVDGMVECVSRILGLAEHDWQVMSKNAYSTAIQYTWEKSTKIFEESLHRACAKSKNLISGPGESRGVGDGV